MIFVHHLFQKKIGTQVVNTEVATPNKGEKKFSRTMITPRRTKSIVHCVSENEIRIMKKANCML